MSTVTDSKDSDDYVDWLETAISNEHLDYFEYSEFKNTQPIGDGTFGSVFRANWKDTNTIFALKFFKNQKSTLKEAVNEIKLHRKVHLHANILKIHGITKTEPNVFQHMNIYALVLEYADGGTLKTYLDEHFIELEWDDKLRLASQLAGAILCLHEREIVHRDLHANNILIHQKNIKLGDFGLSKKIAIASNNTSKIFGVLPYTDPESFSYKNYRLNKKSDIYGIGVIMWQISSGRQPFENTEYDIHLTLAIRGGQREKIIDGTPVAYSNLYTKCWKKEPNERPDIQDIVESIRNMRNVNQEKKEHSLVENNSNLKSSKESDSNLNYFSESVSNVVQEIFWYQEAAENGNKISQYNLGRCYEHGNGVEKDEIKAFELYNKSAEQGYSDAQNSLGTFFENGKGIDKDLKTAIYWYQKAAENENKIAQYNLAKCYEYGNGIEKDEIKAIEWYEKSAEQEYSDAQYSLGFFFEIGKGIEKDLERSTYWYQKAAENGNKDAQYNLSRSKVAAAADVAESLTTIGSSLEIAKVTLGSVGTVGEAIKPFVPLIAVVMTVIGEIIKIYEGAEYNKRICNALMDRVEVADVAIKTLSKRNHENEKNFLDKEYYHAFVKFTDVMKRIKDFMKDISQLQGYTKFLRSGSIKDKYNSLVKEFDTIIMKDLNFSMTIDNEEQRRIDQQALDEDIAEMSKYLEKIEGGITSHSQINTVLQEVLLIKSQIDHFADIKRSNLPIPETIKATKIEPHELVDPLEGKATDRRGKKEPYIVKKCYQTSIEVACLPTTIPEDNSMKAQKIQAQLTILEKLIDSPNILKFYGISHVDDNLVMVLEWAEYGSLREVYNKYEIAWTAKVSIALGICRGITYLHSCSILHHDIRCANVMINSRLEPKLTNFEYARLTTDYTSNITNMTEIVHWLSPEKLRNANRQQYNAKCEIFSFGMLLWELAFEKIPYEDWDMNKIRDHVLSNKREKISFGEESPTIQKLQTNYAKIIVSAWQDDPQIRASLQQIFLDLHAMDTEFCSAVINSPVLKPDKSVGGLDLPELDIDFDIDAIVEIMPLDDGIAAHKRKEMQVAWECFSAHADLGNTTAKYWKGYYLWEGFVGQKDRVEASKIFKEAADDGLPDAQLRYAFSLVGNPEAKFDKKVFIEYLTKAADNNNSTAQFNLGDLYMHGKLGVPKNEELGTKYLRLAALFNQPKAIEILTRLNIKIYNQ